MRKLDVIARELMMINKSRTIRTAQKRVTNLLFTEMSTVRLRYLSKNLTRGHRAPGILVTCPDDAKILS